MLLKGHLNSVRIPYFCLLRCRNYSRSDADESLPPTRSSWPLALRSRCARRETPAVLSDTACDDLLICFLECTTAAVGVHQLLNTNYAPGSRWCVTDDCEAVLTEPEEDLKEITVAIFMEELSKIEIILGM